MKSLNAYTTTIHKPVFKTGVSKFFVDKLQNIVGRLLGGLQLHLLQTFLNNISLHNNKVFMYTSYVDFYLHNLSCRLSQCNT